MDDVSADIVAAGPRGGPGSEQRRVSFWWTRYKELGLPAVRYTKFGTTIGTELGRCVVCRQDEGYKSSGTLNPESERRALDVT